MKVYKEETSEGALQSITFRADEDESQADFRVEVKAWIKANQSMTWEQFIDRLLFLGGDRITLGLT